MARRDAWRLASDWELLPLPSPTALELAVQISDVALRRQTFDDALYLAMEGQSSPAARRRLLEAMEEAAVPEEWKAPWRAKLRKAEARR